MSLFSIFRKGASAFGDMNIAKQKTDPTKMTEGPLLVKILLFTLPVMLTNLLQTFYNAADMMVVSLSAEENAVGAIGTTGAMINLVLNIFMGLSIGANVIVARRIGAGDSRGVSRAVHTSLIAGLALGVLGIGVGMPVARPLLSFLGARSDLLDLAVLYTRIYFIGLPFISLTNFLISIFRAKGDTRTPFRVLTISGLFNVGFNLFFVLVMNLSVEGVAMATTGSNLLSTLLLLWQLSKCRGSCRFSFRRLRFDLRALRDMALVGFPASLQGVLFSISNMTIQSSILQVNNTVVPAGESFQPIVSGNAAAGNLEGFAYTATNAVYQASITFTGQNAGAGKYRRVWRVMGCCYLITSLIGLLLGGAFCLLRQPLLSLYGVHPAAEGTLEQMAYHTACVRMIYMLPLYFLLATMEVGSGVLRGLGKSFISTTVSLIGICVFRVVWIFTVFRATGTLEMIYISYPISWGLTALVNFICAAIYLRKQEKR